MVASDSVSHSGLVVAYLFQTFGLSVSASSFLQAFYHGVGWWLKGFVVLKWCFHQVRGWLQQLMLPPRVVWSGGTVGGPSCQFQSNWNNLNNLQNDFHGGGLPHHHPDGLLVGGGGTPGQGLGWMVLVF